MEEGREGGRQADREKGGLGWSSESSFCPTRKSEEQRTWGGLPGTDSIPPALLHLQCACQRNAGPPASLPRRPQNVLSKKLHIFTGVEYDGLLGPLIGIASSSWVWRMQFTNISWTAPEPLSASFKATLKEQVPKDVKKVGFAPEPYAFGKQVHRDRR